MNKNTDYFLRNSVWVGIRELVTICLGLLTMAIVARVVPKEVYGRYQLILSILATISILSIPGLNTAIIQSVARKFDGSYRKAVRTSFKWSLLGSLIIAATGLYLHFYKQSPVGIPLAISSFFFSFLYAPNTWESFLQGKAKFKIITKYLTIKNFVCSSFFILTISLFPSNLLVITISFLFINSIVNLLLYKNSLKYIKNVKVDHKTIPYGFFITRISIIGIISTHLDKIIIAIFIGPVELAIYAIGINLIKKITSLLKGFLSIASPIISKKNTLSKKNYSIIFIISLVASIFLYLLIPFFVNILLSNKYADSIPIIKTIVLFLPFFAIGALYKNHFTLFVKNKKILRTESILTPLIRIILVLVLSYKFGLMGLSLAFGLQYPIPIIVLFFLSLFLKK